MGAGPEPSAQRQHRGQQQHRHRCQGPQEEHGHQECRYRVPGRGVLDCRQQQHGNQGAGDESQTIRIGTAQNQTFMAGIAGTPIVGNGATVMIDTVTGQLGLGGGSSARHKQDIAPMGASSENVLQLRPVTFAYKEDAQHVKHYGLVAEEVEKVFPELVTHTALGEVQTVKYQELIPMLLNELQRQQQTLQSQAQALQSQQQALLVQAQALQRQQQELAELRILVGQGREMAASSR